LYDAAQGNSQAMAIGEVMSMRLVTVPPTATVADAIARMVAAGVGSVAVTDRSRLVGILTERDILRLAAEGTQFDRVTVQDAMTSSLVTISPDADVVAAAQLMRERQIRHLPVVEGENVLGVVGIRDVLAVLAERLWREHDSEAHETVGALLARGRP
jgi:CBS domain-containing protein